MGHFPTAGLVSFLAFSAYHFGQSQFAKYKNIKKSVKVFLYITWGLAVISGLCVYNQTEILQNTSSSTDLIRLQPLFDGVLFHSLLVICSTLFAARLLSLYKLLGIRTVIFELAVFALIQICFLLNPVLIGFSIYFASLHSLHVLQQEFKFLRTRIEAFSWYNFIVMLTPYTLVSLFGLVFLLGLSHYGIVAVSKTLLVFATISALTLPHSLVMERFYSQNNT